MSDSDEYLPSANSMESFDTSHSSSRGEMEVPSTFSLKKENRVHQTKISTKTYKEGFSPAVFRSRLGQKSSRYWMFNLLRLCFGFCGEIYVKNE